MYQHRDEDEARLQVQFLLEALRNTPRRLLDVACGNGRHLTEFEKSGVLAIGADLSLELLRAEVAPSLLRVRADMRDLPFSAGVFDTVTSMFTSFGYFETDADHQALLREWRRVTSPAGQLIIDYLNREYVITHLRENERQVRGDLSLSFKRRIDGRRVVKEITLFDSSENKTQHFRESVLMYSESELGTMLAAAGFRIEREFGNFDGSSYTKGSPRLIVIARAQESV